MSLAEKLAEKVCGNSSLPTRRWLGHYDEVLAAINEAILLTKNEWIERCAQECELERDSYGEPGWVQAEHNCAERIRALKEQP